ncbi:MAG: hypothetical protein GX589_09290 [Deltaproteobacteria bacterium]|nr:hypothetical protein [Deltaproteobacteria bacterium]
MLDKQTPRQAAQTKHSSEHLEMLFKYYQETKGHSDTNPFGPDIPALRAQLGLDKMQ